MEASLFLEHEGLSFPEIRGWAAEAEGAGLAGVWIQDHLFFTRRPLLEAFAVLAALARTTERVRLGTLVACASYRNPALLAKMGATVDRLSGGRFVLGLGAGWHRAEYEAYGYPFPPPGERVGRLEETLQVVHRLWTEERVTFRGRYVAVEDAPCDPKPVQRPRPPLWVGGGGPRVLRIAARHADGVNLLSPPAAPFDAAAIARRVAYVRRHRTASDPFVTSILALAVLGEEPAEVRRGVRTLLAKYAARTRPRAALEAALRQPRAVLSYLGFLLGRGYPSFLLAGDPSGVADRLRSFAEAGVDHAVLDLHSSGLGPRAFELLVEEVLPAL